MFTIGDFARQGRVSVRMLRHYDAIGLLRPALTDARTGYRLYEAAQLSRLNRLVALKDLGFSLEQVAAILDEKVGSEELRGMLRLRRAELQEQITADTVRLEEVEARLRLIETEGNPPLDDLVRVQTIPAMRVAELVADAVGFEPTVIGPVAGPLFNEVCTRVERAGLTVTGPTLAYYEPFRTDGSVIVHAAVPVDAADDLTETDGLAIVDLPAIERAATILHHGPMQDVLTTVQTLARWMDAHNEVASDAPYRERYVEITDDMSTWITELQEPLR